jgi:metal-responsive CopG/Arc/MetJ family transcriptional regulator
MRGADVATDTEMIRTHVVLPRGLVEEIDRLVGQRKRSEFIAQALDERLLRERQRRALQDSAGVLDPADYPHWATPEETSEWVRTLRREADEKTLQKWREHT